jgi:hypothetical protein
MSALLTKGMGWTDNHQGVVIAGLVACAFSGAALLRVMG